MRYRLCAGVINAYVSEDPEWENFTLDVTDRGVWHPGLNMAIRPDFIGDISNLVDFRDSMFDEVRLHHVLEHLELDRAIEALEEIHRVLIPGGMLDIEVPDIGRVMHAWCNDEYDLDALQQWIYGESLGDPADHHRYGWTGATLRVALEMALFEIVDQPKTGLAVRFICQAVEAE